ncbi:MAG: glycosyltransferase family 4 protein [Candidatus Atabeyarchaeum deiterrae]
MPHAGNDALRVAFIQNVCTPYNSGFYEELARSEGVDFVFYFGNPGKNREHMSFTESELSKLDFTFKYRFLPTFVYPGSLQESPFHWKRALNLLPTLLPAIAKGKHDVVITEGAGFILNLIPLFVFCKLAGKRLIIWDGGNIKDNAPKSTDSIIKKVAYIFVRFITRHEDAAVVYGEGSKDFQTYLGADSRKIFIAPNTVNNKLFERIISKRGNEIANLRSRLGLQGKKTIVYVGSLERRKKVDHLLEMFRRLKGEVPYAALLIIGDGPDKNYLLKLKAEKRLKDVHFLGKITYLDMPLYYDLSDVFCLPSQGGITVVEAMACGKPIVISDQNNLLLSLPGIVRQGENGFIVKEGDLDAFVDRFVTLITSDSLTSKMGLKSKEMIKKRFSVDKMIQGFIQAISYVMRNHGK